MLHFAYGANMSRDVMRKHAPAARPLGVAVLAGYRFIIGGDGYASVEPARMLTQTVHGVLWRITASDRAKLDVWEDVEGGLYRCETMPVRIAGRRLPALVYVGRRGSALARLGSAPARPGYMELVLAAAREWGLPDAYMRSLARFLPEQAGGARDAKIGVKIDAKIREFRW